MVRFPTGDSEFGGSGTFMMDIDMRGNKHFSRPFRLMQKRLLKIALFYLAATCTSHYSIEYK
jgi:hypothetical protein